MRTLIKIARRTTLIAIPCLALLWYFGRDAWILERQANEYAAHTPEITIGTLAYDPDRLPVLILPTTDAVIFDIGALRLVLQGRQTEPMFQTRIPITKDAPTMRRSIFEPGEVSFAADYSEGKTNIILFDTPMIYESGTLRVADQVLSTTQSAVVVLNEKNTVVLTRLGPHAGI